MRELTISEREAGQRLDRFLGKYLPKAPAGFLHKMLRKKNIKRNGSRAGGGEKLEAGDRIQIYFSEETLQVFGEDRQEKRTTEKRLTEAEKKLRGEIRVLMETEDIIILHKPAGMLTQKAKEADDSLNDYLLDYCLEQGRLRPCDIPSFRPSVANRLDRNTSGIVLCGATIRGLQMLGRWLRDREIEKYYLCVVRGAVTGSRKIRGYLTKDGRNNQVVLSDAPFPGSAPIETWYQALGTDGEATLLRVRLITGKSHQIRAHLASEGNPVAGDMKYGDKKWNQALRREGICCQMLHSHEVRFPSGCADIPKEYAGIRIRDPIPEEFAAMLERRGLFAHRQMKESFDLAGRR